MVTSAGTASDAILYTDYLPYTILLGIITALNLLALGTFRYRVFQLRTTNLSAIITLALQIWLAVDFFATRDLVIFNVTAVFPIVAVILDVLAARGILADQLLVESASRLRRRKK